MTGLVLLPAEFSAIAYRISTATNLKEICTICRKSHGLVRVVSDQSSPVQSSDRGESLTMSAHRIHQHKQMDEGQDACCDKLDSELGEGAYRRSEGTLDDRFVRRVSLNAMATLREGHDHVQH